MLQKCDVFNAIRCITSLRDASTDVHPSGLDTGENSVRNRRQKPSATPKYPNQYKQDCGKGGKRDML